MRFRIFSYLSFLFILICTSAKGQKVYKIIEKYEKAVFTIITYGETDSKNDTASGFFINPSGIAIVPANVFSNNDSGVITLKNNKTYSVSQVLSTHAMANLCLIKVVHPQGKSFDYIIPSQKTTSNQSEILVMCHPEDAESSLSYGEITKVYHAPYLDRLVEVSAKTSYKSNGSPVINSNGDLIGISARNLRFTHFYSTHVLNDTLWRKHASDLPHVKYRKSARIASLMNNGVLNFMHEDWIESAKVFSQVLKLDSLNAKALMFRAESRRQYQNRHGSDLDIDRLCKLDANTFLVDYFNAEYNLANGNIKTAFLDYISCIEKHNSYAPALVGFGLLVMQLRNDLETAEDCFNKAIAASPLYANGFYERGRFIFQHLNFNERALKDIDRAVQLNPFLPGVYSIRGTLKIQTENYLGAISDFDKAIEYDKRDMYALFNRGIAFYNIGMKENCCADWIKAEMLGHYKATKFISQYCNEIVIDISPFE